MQQSWWCSCLETLDQIDRDELCQTRNKGSYILVFVSELIDCADAWADEGVPGRVLSNYVWINKVLELCGLMGYQLPKINIDDERKPGSFYACHAEKQLIAYYLSRHVFLPNEIGWCHPIDEATWDTVDSGKKPLQLLSEVQPPLPPEGATILVSEEICSDCEEFAAWAVGVFSVRLNMLHV
jgi:hypothetical protein